MCSNDLMTYFPDRPISETYFSDLGVLKNTTGQRRQLMREFHWKVPKPPLWHQLLTQDWYAGALLKLKTNKIRIGFEIPPVGLKNRAEK